MEIVTVTVLAVLSLLVIPVLLSLCADSEKDEPQLKSVSKKGSKPNSKRDSAKSVPSPKRQSKGDNPEESTVIANGNTAVRADGSGESPSKLADSSAHAYEDPEALTHHPKDINDALTNAGGSSPKASVVNETSSPGSSQRSSRASGGQPRVVSQDRALPEIPGQPNRLSANSDRSPSTKRALPELPSTVAPVPAPAVPSAVSSADDEGANLYDQLERDLPPHQIKSKASSESSSVKVKMRFAIEEENDSGSSENLIEPDEITRSSVFVSTNPVEVYSSVSDPETTKPTTSDGQATGASLKPAEMTKSKAKAQYTKIKKDSASTEGKTAGSGSMKLNADVEPVYSVAPPVPAKMYDVNDELGAAAKEAASAGAVAIVVDNNAQDSGSGYYAVTDDGPAPDVIVAEPHDGLPESYDILTARESIVSVRNRQANVDEDYYESMDDKPAGGSAAADQSEAVGGTEIYSEIDNQQQSTSINAADSTRPASRMSIKEELYAEIDSPEPSTSRLNNGPSTANANRQLGDSGYEKVDFTSSKGEQTDSAGYAIVKDAASASTANHIITSNDDEEDYAECDPVPGAGVQRISPSDLNHQLLRHGSDVSDYATVSDARGSTAVQEVPAQSPPINDSERPFQKYKRKEHLYQEIDVAREDKNPPDKEN